MRPSTLDLLVEIEGVVRSRIRDNSPAAVDSYLKLKVGVTLTDIIDTFGKRIDICLSKTFTVPPNPYLANNFGYIQCLV